MIVWLLGLVLAIGIGNTLNDCVLRDGDLSMHFKNARRKLEVPHVALLFLGTVMRWGAPIDTKIYGTPNAMPSMALQSARTASHYASQCHPILRYTQPANAGNAGITTIWCIAGKNWNRIVMQHNLRQIKNIA